MATDENVNIDAVIEQLLEVRKHPKIEKIELKENDIRLIIHKAREIFLSQPVLLELGEILKLNYLVCFALSYILNRSSIKNLR
jgi:serine/threonine-protein phosphatase PP1 catalytic subunit